MENVFSSLRIVSKKVLIVLGYYFRNRFVIFNHKKGGSMYRFYQNPLFGLYENPENLFWGDTQKKFFARFKEMSDEMIRCF